MDKYGHVSITATALMEMTEAQFKSLKENVVTDQLWKNAPKVMVIMDFGTLMVSPLDDKDKPMILMGIEKDGYCHS